MFKKKISLNGLKIGKFLILGFLSIGSIVNADAISDRLKTCDCIRDAAKDALIAYKSENYNKFSLLIEKISEMVDDDTYYHCLWLLMDEVFPEEDEDEEISVPGSDIMYEYWKMKGVDCECYR